MEHFRRRSLEICDFESTKHIDKVGSIKVGKDADIVLWNNNPLSIYAKAEKTIIEGVVYYDVEKIKLQR
jgi:imidazolonepropionase-like amidohydrolase